MLGPQEGPELGEPLVEGRQALTARVDEGGRATRENGGVPERAGCEQLVGDLLVRLLAEAPSSRAVSGATWRQESSVPVF